MRVLKTKSKGHYWRSKRRVHECGVLSWTIVLFRHIRCGTLRWAPKKGIIQLFRSTSSLVSVLWFLPSGRDHVPSVRRWPVAPNRVVAWIVWYANFLHRFKFVIQRYNLFQNAYMDQKFKACSKQKLKKSWSPLASSLDEPASVMFLFARPPGSVSYPLKRHNFWSHGWILKKCIVESQIWCKKLANHIFQSTIMNYRNLPEACRF